MEKRFRKPDARLGRFHVWKRPHADTFIRWLAKKGVRVGFWSTAMEHNVVKLIAWLLPNPRDRARISFVWDGSMCTDTGRRDPKNRHKPIVLKKLEKLWSSTGTVRSDRIAVPSKSRPSNSRKDQESVQQGERRMGFGAHNTVLIDDSEVKATANPPFTSIHPPPWSIEDGDDNFLGKNGIFRNYISDLLQARDTQQFLQERPFHMEELQRVQLVRIDSPPREMPVEGNEEGSSVSSDSDECIDVQEKPSCLACLRQRIQTEGKKRHQESEQTLLVRV